MSDSMIAEMLKGSPEALAKLQAILGQFQGASREERRRIMLEQFKESRRRLDALIKDLEDNP